MIGAMHIANSILLKAKYDNVEITPKKLYYMVYLLYSNVLYNYGFKLFNEPFSITDIGPVVPSIYYKFNSYGNKRIKKYASNATGQILYANGENFNKYLEEVWYVYKDFSELELYNIIAKNNSAYDMTRKRNEIVLKDSDILSDEINNNEIILENAKVLKNKFKERNY